MSKPSDRDKKPESSDLERKIPLLKSRLSRGGLTAMSKTVKTFLGNLKPSYRPGRSERLSDLVHDLLVRSPFAQNRARRGSLRFRIQVNESFGKPLLVNFDLLVPQKEWADPDRTAFSLLEDVFERVTEALWHNPEVAPVAVRGRVLVVEDIEAVLAQPFDSRQHMSDPPGSETLMDMMDMGFRDEIARVSDLYERFGPPKADPNFHP